MQQEQCVNTVDYHGRSLYKGLCPSTVTPGAVLITVCLEFVCADVLRAMMELYVCCLQEAVHGMVLHAA